jgi:hypothetical protein
MPTNTTERVPSADVMSVSWEVLGVAGKAVSGIKKSSVATGIAAFHATYTTPADRLASVPVLTFASLGSDLFANVRTEGH